ncbi:MAG: hypothetical protein AB8B68_05235 [Rickettsiaceae bacterium]
MKKIAVALLCIVSSFSSFAEIYAPDNISEIKGMVVDIFEKRNSQKTLFIFPLDSILRPTHPAMQKQEKSYNSLLKKAFDKANSSTSAYVNILLLTEYPSEISDPDLPDLINYIQNNDAGLIITTPNFTGEVNDIKRLDVWTFNYLKSKKIDLTKGIFANVELVFNQKLKKIAGSYPAFYKGLLSYNSDKLNNSSMQVISTFLALELQKIPDVVVAVGSTREYLESLEKQLKILREDNEFFGILYNLPALKTKEIAPEEYLKFWQNFVKKINKLKTKNVDLKSENPYEE